MNETRIDDKEFQRALKLSIETSSRSAAVVLASRLYNIAKRAQIGTPKADRAKIEADLGVSGYKLIRSKDKSTGRRVLKRGKAILGSGGGQIRNLYALVQSRINKVGGSAANNLTDKQRTRFKNRGSSNKAMNRAGLDKAVRKFVASKLRAIGTLRRGWNKPMQQLWRWISRKDKPPLGSLPTGARVKQAGEASVKDTGNPWAQMAYDMTVQSKTNPHIDPRVEQALGKAFRAEAAEMKRHIETKLNKDLSKLSRKL